MPKSELFSSVDAAWLHMDKPANMALIVGVMMFDAPLNVKRLKATLEHRLLPFFPRFAQRVREPRLGLGLPQWEAVRDFDLDQHVQRVELPAPGDEAALQMLAGEIMSRPLDRSKPLWQMYVVERYGAGSALISCIHHCVADGLALVQVLLSLTDTDPKAPWPKAPAPAERRRQRPWLTRLLAQTVKAVDQTRAAAENIAHEGMEALTHPFQTAERLAMGASFGLALGKLTLLSPDKKTVIKGQCGVPKRAAWSAPLPLTEVKAVAHAFEGTVNDVLLAAAVGGLRRYLEGREQPVDGLNVRALVPVNLRPPEKLDELGNKFGLVLLSLPVGVRDPLRRIRALKKRMDAIKDTPEAFVAFNILGAMGLTPAQIEELIVKFFASKASAVMTNVPGPREVLYFAGRPIRGIMFWVPQPGNLALGVSLLSYAGEVRVGVATDEGLLPDPQTIVAGVIAEFAAMKQATLPKPKRKTPAKARSKPVTAPRRKVAKKVRAQLPAEGRA
jgi:WS/DGAT/MGAT family acyltransferase